MCNSSPRLSYRPKQNHISQTRVFNPSPCHWLELRYQLSVSIWFYFLILYLDYSSPWNHEMLGSPVLSIKSKIDSDLPMILCQLEIIKFIHKLMIVSKLNRSLTRLFIKWLIHRQFLKFLRTKQRHFIAIDFHWIAVQHQIKISVVTFFVLIIFAISVFPQD